MGVAMTYPRISRHTGFTSCSADAMKKAARESACNTQHGPEHNRPIKEDNMPLIPCSGGAIDSQDALPIGYYVRRVMARIGGAL